MISIIVPVYNVQKYLPTTLNSILNQEGVSDYEVILVDDGSTDDSSMLCDSYVAYNESIHVIHKVNGGLSSARNAGLQLAQGEYVLFLDGDDCLDVCTLSTLSKAVNDHPECDLIQFRYEEVHPAAPYGHKTDSHLVDYFECNNPHDFFYQLYIQGGVAASACTKLIRRSILENLCFREGIIHEDEEFTTRLLFKCKRIGYCSNQFYKYVMREGSIIHSGFSNNELQVITILNERIDLLKQCGYVDLVRSFRSRLFINLCLLWTKAYSLNDCTSLNVIESSMKQLFKEGVVELNTMEHKIIFHSALLRPLIQRVIFHSKRLIKPFKVRVQNLFIRSKKINECKRRRQLLTKSDFSIISNNCWGGLIYQYFGMPYTSPTVGLFFMDDDYIKLLERLDYYLAQELRFIPLVSSRYWKKLQSESTAKQCYPVALLDDIEVHFLHYHSEKEAAEKWYKRLQRLNRNQLLIKMSQRSMNSEEILDRFEALSFQNKICFTEYHRDNPIFITVPELHLLNIQGGDETPFVLEKVDIVKLINSIK